MIRIVWLLLLMLTVHAQIIAPRARTRIVAAPLEKQIAAHFAPIIYQALAEQPRFDYITNFDFDGDWRGDNNWVNADKKQYVMRAQVYYSLIETTTHYFIHYAFFHPRDYKGGLAKSTLLEVLIKEGIRHAGTDPTGRADDVALSHENDLEGCLVVAAKQGGDFKNAQLQFVETMAHNRFYKMRAPETSTGVGELIEVEATHPLLYIEPKGHGVYKYSGDKEQVKKATTGILVYRYTGVAEDHEKLQGLSIGYDLVPIFDTFWLRAKNGANEMFGEIEEFKQVQVAWRTLDGKDVQIDRQLGSLGVAFLGNVGFKNKARPPWAWFDDRERDRPRGEWFFNPAAVIARHYVLDQSFSQLYLYNQYLQIGEAGR